MIATHGTSAKITMKDITILLNGLTQLIQSDWWTWHDGYTILFWIWYHRFKNSFRDFFIFIFETNISSSLIYPADLA